MKRSLVLSSSSVKRGKSWSPPPGIAGRIKSDGMGPVLGTQRNGGHHVAMPSYLLGGCDLRGSVFPGPWVPPATFMGPEKSIHSVYKKQHVCKTTASGPEVWKSLEGLERGMDSQRLWSRDQFLNHFHFCFRKWVQGKGSCDHDCSGGGGLGPVIRDVSGGVGPQARPSPP